MLRLGRTQLQPIGLDIGLDSVKLMQLAVQDGQSLAVHAAARAALPPDVRAEPRLQMAAATQVVGRLIRGHGFTGRRVIAALPAEIVHVKNLRLPMMPPAEIAAAVEFEARNIFKFDADQAIIRHLPVGEVRHGSDTKMEVIALAAKRIEVDAFVEQLHRGAGCLIESLDFEPSAIYRGIDRFIRRREDENEVHVLVDIGARRTQVIIGRGRDISFVKPIEIGSANLHEAVAKKLEITADEARSLRRRQIDASAGADAADPVRQAVKDALRSTVEDLAREISLCLRYYSVTFRGQRPSRVKLLGGESGDPVLQSLLAAAFPIPVEPARPLSSVNLDRMAQSDRHGYMGEWAVAFGLGLKRTIGPFADRAGKPRDPASKSDNGSRAEVVEIGRAVTPAAADAQPQLEVANA